MKFLPGPAEWLFSVKTFAAAMLALYIGLATGLDRPYWALASVYIVSQPLSGALRSKAIFRLAGTVLGAVVCIVLVPNLVNAPELLSLSLAAWTGLCLYVSLLDRTPRSYVFMLAGYTAAIIGFPTVTTPEAIWDTALWRVEEISLGIVCSTVVGSIVFPRPVGPVLVGRIRAWLDDAGRWADDVLAERTDTHASRIDRARLAADVAELAQLETLLTFDTSTRQTSTRWVRALRQRMVFLLPVLSAISDRLAALRAIDAITPDMRALMEALGDWRRDSQDRTDPAAVRAGAAVLRARIAAALDRTDSGLDWRDALLISLLQRLREWIDIEQDCRVLLRHIASGGARLDTPLVSRRAASTRMHRDHAMAALSGAAAAVAILLICAFWILAGWQAGAVAAEMAAVACSFFATRDDPVPAIKVFLYASVAAVAADVILLFAILPMAHDFETLAAALALMLLPAGALIAMPATSLPAMAIAATGTTMLGLQETYTADFPSFMDSGIALAIGMTTAAAATALLRSVGADWSARRLLRHLWHDLARVAAGRTAPGAAALVGLSLDRLGLAVPRLSVGGSEKAAASALAELRVGHNLISLRRTRPMMTTAVGTAVDAVLAGASAHFAAQVRHGARRGAAPAMLRAVDGALDAAGTAQGRRRRDIVLALVGIRRGLFPLAPPYHAVPDVAEAIGRYQKVMA